MAVKIIQVGDLNVEDIYSRIQSGENIPRHSCLWGYDALLKEGFEVIAVQAPKPKSIIYNYFINRLFAMFGVINIPLAIQTLKTLRKHPDARLIYTHYITQSNALSYLRRLKIIKIPIIGIAHDAFLKYTDIRSWKRHDMVISLCENTLRLALSKTEVPRNCLHYIDWGADNNYLNKYKPKNPPSKDYFLATGIENRDYDLLVDAFREMPQFKLIIASSRYKSNTCPSNVSIVNDIGCNSFFDMLPLYYNAIASIIPLKENLSWCCGGTVLFQSIAMGIPLIVSEAQANLIDVEKEGVGLSVRMGDKIDLINAVKKIEENPELQELFSNNGITLATSRYNYDMFCNQLIGYIKLFVK